MTKAEPAADTAAAAHGGETVLSLKGILLRGVVGIGIVAAIVVSGVAIYRNQRDQAGLPAAIAPAPHQTVAPSVDDVITGLETRLKTEPQDADGWRMLGWSYFQHERYAESADALRHATKLDPTNARTFSFLGEALVLASKKEGRMPREARAAFDKALKLDPKDARARYFRAVSWDLAGQHRRAIHAWFSLLKDTPADAPYAGDIRAVIRTVAARHHINVEKRLAEVQFAAPGSTPATDADKNAGPGAKGAAALIPAPSGEHMRAAEGLPQGKGAPGSESKSGDRAVPAAK
ncbi:TPR repeat-containing protein [Novosphingobium nitrogenifigens DSM 19370]|uniref:TPR repeat-containing protein n=1 Tax=Novosphingobium nitrogenifigens DSM 19370 TaxID=983920 RepID=F1Z6P7_9SPHN|nr:tetratricopeptide repeat protein [Novosphingobium nitrogenifigens]EGD59707.1 TPR repeat-containing protein [Novosphingobium nitrogenifigens DSM 19370]